MYQVSQKHHPSQLHSVTTTWKSSTPPVVLRTVPTSKKEIIPLLQPCFFLLPLLSLLSHSRTAIRHSLLIPHHRHFLIISRQLTFFFSFVHTLLESASTCLLRPHSYNLISLRSYIGFCFSTRATNPACRSRPLRLQPQASKWERRKTCRVICRMFLPKVEISRNQSWSQRRADFASVL